MNDIQWFKQYCADRFGSVVSEEAIKLALAANTRSNSDSTHDWQAKNAIRFESVLREAKKSEAA